ncbi:MAG: hypothetical protein H7833_08500 [Magnetococcus sp. DMHC-1]
MLVLNKFRLLVCLFVFFISGQSFAERIVVPPAGHYLATCRQLFGCPISNFTSLTDFAYFVFKWSNPFATGVSLGNLSVNTANIQNYVRYFEFDSKNGFLFSRSIPGFRGPVQFIYDGTVYNSTFQSDLYEFILCPYGSVPNEDSVCICEDAFDQASYSCLLKKCDSGRAWNNELGMCVDLCNSGFAWDGIAGKCVPDSPFCSQGFVWNDIKKMCVGPPICTSDISGTYLDGSTGICLQPNEITQECDWKCVDVANPGLCRADEYYDEVEKLCISQSHGCAGGFWDGVRCVYGQSSLPTPVVNSSGVHSSTSGSSSSTGDVGQSGSNLGGKVEVDVSGFSSGVQPGSVDYGRSGLLSSSLADANVSLTFSKDRLKGLIESIKTSFADLSYSFTIPSLPLPCFSAGTSVTSIEICFEPFRDVLSMLGYSFVIVALISSIIIKLR